MVVWLEEAFFKILGGRAFGKRSGGSVLGLAPLSLIAKNVASFGIFKPKRF